MERFGVIVPHYHYFVKTIRFNHYFVQTIDME